MISRTGWTTKDNVLALRSGGPGNQGDAENVKRFGRDRFLTARWPKTAPPPTGGPRILRPDGSFSDNEQ